MKYILITIALSIITMSIVMLTTEESNIPHPTHRPYFVQLEEELDSIIYEIEQDTVSLFDRAIEHLKHHEGFRSNWYIGAGGSKLIGYGHKQLKGETYAGLTPMLATRLLEHDFCKHLALVENKYTQFKPHQQIALALFSFNLGNTALAKAISSGITSDTNKWLKYCHYKSKGAMVKSKPLARRRAFEVKMFNGK